MPGIKPQVDEELLKRLIETPAPSGFEKAFQDFWLSLVSPFADEGQAEIIDNLGNAVAVLNKGGYPRVMFVAHCDEVRMAVGSIMPLRDEPGAFIYLRDDESLDLSIVPSRAVYIITRQGKKIKGIIGRWSIHDAHIYFEQEEPQERKIHLYWIDIGAANVEQIKKRGIAVGDPVIFAEGYQKLNDHFYSGRNIDNRAGVYALIELLRELHCKRKKLKAEIVIVSSVQEENRDSMPVKLAAEKMKPHLGIVVDLTPSSDYPPFDYGERDQRGFIFCGNGPVLGRGPEVTDSLVEFFERIAKRHRINYVVEALSRSSGSMTEVNELQMANGGTPAALVSIPGRYLHSPHQVAAFRDLVATQKLLVNFALAVNEKTKFGYK